MERKVMHGGLEDRPPVLPGVARELARIMLFQV
jgi:hypothetical protein